MSEIYQKDDSIHEPTTAHMHPLETTPQGSQADSAEGSHEHRDVSFNALGKWFSGLFIGIFLSFVAMIFFFKWGIGLADHFDGKPSAMFTERKPLEHPWPDPIVKSPLEKPGDMPMLLPYPDEPLREFRAEEEARLEGLDSKGKKAGLNIDEAMAVTVMRGLPTQPPALQTKKRPAKALADLVRPSGPV